MIVATEKRNSIDSGYDVSVERKVPGGKYLKVTLNITNDTIEECSVSGDFFVYPENIIELLEKSLINKKAEGSVITKELKDFMENKCDNVEFIGIQFEDITQMILECIAKRSLN